MKTLKRALTVVGIVLSILVLVVSAAGIVVSWTAGSALKDVSNKVLTGVERGLDATDDALDRVDDRLEGARANINTVEEAVTQVGEDIEETNFALLLIEETVGEELLPKIESAQETLSTVRASLVAFNTTLEAANEIPFVSAPTLTDELDAASERAAESKSAVDEMKTAIKVAKSGAVDGAVGAITQRTSKIDNAMEELQGEVADYQSKIAKVDDDVSSLKSRIRLWIDVATIIVSLGFVWVAISQVAMLGLGWSYLRNGELVLRKKQEQAIAEAPEELVAEEPASGDDGTEPEPSKDEEPLAGE
jgi:peptidoglycan hydrolase CwlO-like protein